MKKYRKSCLFAFVGFLGLMNLAMPLLAQTFNSGSTGADGALNPTCPVGQGTCVVTLPLPPNGIFNFTTVTIPASLTLKFTRNALNTPVIMLASGDVSIQGVINLDGGVAGGSLGVAFPGRGGPGGYDGGLGGRAGTFLLSMNGSPGLGPGGGKGGDASSATVCERGGNGGAYGTVGFNICTFNGTGGATPYGVHTLYPIVGGSGGGGGAGNSTLDGAGGAGGGGAIVIASSGNITLNANAGGRISAMGGNNLFGSIVANPGGNGSGGAIRLVANTVNCISCSGGGYNISAGSFSNNGTFGFGSGRIRVEAYAINWPNVFPEVSRGLPGPLAFPSIKITSVGGVNTPSNTVGTFIDSADVILNPSQPNPITINVAASNVPLGTVVQLTTISEAVVTPVTVLSTPLAGTLVSSTATANVTLPPGASVITVTAMFTAAP